MNILDYGFNRKSLSSLIKDSDKYFSHTSDIYKNEKLLDHLLLVQSYFFKFIEIYKLENIIINMISKYSDDILIQKFIFELFVKSIVVHDFGKINPEFQIKKMNNEIDSFPHDLSSGHSLISGYIFILYFEKLAKDYKFAVEDETVIDFLILSFSYPIVKHHSSKLGNIKSDLSYDSKLDDLKKFNFFFDGINDSSFLEEVYQYVFLNSDTIFDTVSSEGINIFSLFALLKLNYSLLTASDYYATTHYVKGWSSIESDFGILNKELKEKIINNIENSKEYNRLIYCNYNSFDLTFPRGKNNENLNKLRQNLAYEVISGVRNNINESLFYIEAPTGGGKTNLSMIALSEFIRNDLELKENNISKIFYVFPFTTLITQTFKSLKDTLGLEDNEIVQIHSKAGYSEKSDDEYGVSRNNIIDYQFINYPVVLLSHIKFFNILKTNNKSDNYLLHRLSHSVVIIDELQAYTPKEWDKIIYFIKNYSDYFKIKFILMSATLPKIDKLFLEQIKDIIIDKSEFVYLNSNKDNYFKNPNFSQRIDFDFSLLNNKLLDKENREIYLTNLCCILIDKSEKYKISSNKKRVHTIIEFIFKKTASEFFNIINNTIVFFDEIFLLSGTIIEPRRKEILSKLKSKEYTDKDILLITTQVVEAGVDIDMDIGFKDSSLIDSDEQLAGRINRNVNKDNSKLYIFDFDDAKKIYGNDPRFKKFNSNFFDQYASILENKSFDIVYDSIIEDKKIINKSDYLINFENYLSSIKKLNFSSVESDFKLIDNDIDTVTIFAPLLVPIKIPKSNELNFSINELDYLKEKGVFYDASLEGHISGEDVWEIYENILLNRDKDFINQKIQIIIIQSLLSKFTFTIGIRSKIFQNIESTGNLENKYGYCYLKNVHDFYDYSLGIKNIEFDEINIW